MSNQSSTILEQMTWHRDSLKLLGADCWKVYDLMLRKGQTYQGRDLPRQYVRREPKRCFYNTRQLVLRSKRLQYCEGWAIGNDLPIMIQHAWAIDSDNQVVDVTLKDPANYQYLGITFDREAIRPRRYTYSGMLSNELGFFRPDVLRALDPELFGQKEAA